MSSPTFNLNPTTTTKKCRNFYRRRENYFHDDSRLVSSVTWYRLKSLSCDGSCDGDRCYYPNLDADEVGYEEVYPDIHCEKPIDGAIYEVFFVPGAKDWETGYIDDWSWKMVLSEEHN